MSFNTVCNEIDCNLGKLGKQQNEEIPHKIQKKTTHSYTPA